MTKRVLARKTNREKRNARIRAQFRKRYTDAPRPRKYSREYILAQLAEEFCLSMHTIEDIIYGAEEAKAAA
ncbi:hypothetical protein [Hymenobacter metallicola]|uniref:Uncharacterized protein n=1 Tax=Hymenobacter metallicola TaxID=2563114 RepID=A0A4Z0Q0M5_9BACT|nr:hypothetical protein [Hymenobacter metallicola]TGE23517.1 hypothetical protein E5K02_20230 [Hymenobacter metallicola]